MSNSVFTVSGSGKLTELTQSEFDSEFIFQELLAKYPEVLGLTAGAQQKLLLLKREQGVPDVDGGSNRWSIDHLFVDERGIPVLVEVKRASDSRARREVVAQMLDYAANGVAYWPIASLVASFEEDSRNQDEDPNDKLARFIGEERNPEEFWKQVEANLRSGRIRMVFVADSIPKELRRIVEFLNEQMTPAEVLAVEIRNYVSATGERTLVPSLVGATERAQANKAATRQQTSIPLEEWMAQFGEHHGPDALKGASRLIGHLQSLGVGFVVSRTGDSIVAKLEAEDGRTAWPFLVRNSTGNFETSLQYLSNRPAYAPDEARRVLLDQISALPGINITTKKITGWPAFPVSMLLRDDLWSSLVPIIESVARNARKS